LRGIIAHVRIAGKMLGRKIRSSLLTEMLTSTDIEPY
jgi:hypothetical protein